MATWTVTNMLVKTQEAGFSNVVYLVSWSASDTDGTNTALRGGEVEVSAPTGEAFVPFEQLTEALVLTWVADVLGAAQVTAIESDLSAQLGYMQSPPVTSPPLPWA